jgi:hypothetical protein
LYEGTYSIEAPVLAGFRLSDGIELVIAPGLVWTEGPSPEAPPADPETGWRGSDEALSQAVYARAGAAIRVRLYKHLALQPSLLFMHSLTGPETNWATFGVGVIGATWF